MTLLGTDVNPPPPPSPDPALSMASREEVDDSREDVPDALPAGMKVIMSWLPMLAVWAAARLLAPPLLGCGVLMDEVNCLCLVVY